MRLLDKIEPLLLLAAVGLGVALSGLPWIAAPAARLVSVFLACMLFGLFWEAPLRDIGRGFRNVRFTLTSLAVNFIWTPFFAWILMGAFMGDSPYLALGLLLLLVTPCTDWYLVFTGISRGNVPLSTAILPVNLIAQVALLPVYILVYSGVRGEISALLLAKSAVLTLAVPFALAKGIKLALAGRGRPAAIMEGLFARRQFAWLWLAVAAMFASERIFAGGYLSVFARITLPVLVFFAATFLVARAASRAARLDFPDSVSLTFTALARNSPLALAFAQRAFPENREVLLPLVIGPLLELPILALLSQVILAMGARAASRAARTTADP
ncbi:MAG: arsenic resistance protein [Deltaproteobacteria bacterium]|jgi:ACR3 family arsenite efflux pump ArsB|nr:arsenic resistance protein [Deltaproteobacteria bacterium]